MVLVPEVHQRTQGQAGGNGKLHRASGDSVGERPFDPWGLSGVAGDRSDHAVDGATVGDVLQALEREHPAAGGWILDERGVIRRHINVFVNGERGDAGTAVAGDDRVDVLPAISGG